MADKLGISKRQVTRAIKILEFYNIIKVARQTGQKSLYWLVDKKYWKKKTITFTKYMSGGNSGKDREAN
jgi:DNA-binding transcriptional regulator GbsR (MarR family)